jgi:hypothetical protein
LVEIAAVHAIRTPDPKYSGEEEAQ